MGCGERNDPYVIEGKENTGNARKIVDGRRSQYLEKYIRALYERVMILAVIHSYKMFIKNRKKEVRTVPRTEGSEIVILKFLLAVKELKIRVIGRYVAHLNV